MKVLSIGDGSGSGVTGGSNVVASELAAVLEKRGHELTVLSAGNGSVRGDLRRFLTYDAGGNTLARMRSVGRSVGTYLKENDCDLIHTHFALTEIGLSSSLRNSHPFLRTFHGPWDLEAEVDEGASTASVKSRMAKAVKRVIRFKIEQRSLKLANSITVLSHCFKELAVERYGISPQKIQLIEGGVDLSRFTPSTNIRADRERLGLESEGEYILSIRRLAPRMGLDLLIQAMPDILRVHPKVILLIGGRGKMKEALEKQVADLDIARSVRFLGFVAEEELPIYLRCVDLVVMPTRALEGFGLVTLEAFASGTNVVATPVGGNQEILEKLNPNLLAKSIDAQAIGETIAENFSSLSRDIDSRRQLHEKVSRIYSWEKYADRTEELYQELISKEKEEMSRIPIKVAYLDHTAQLSGGEIALSRLLSTVNKDLVDPIVILAEEGPLVGRLEESDVQVVVLPLTKKVASIRKDTVKGGKMAKVGVIFHTLSYSRKVAKELKQNGVKIVHTNSLKAAVYGIVVARMAGAKLVWHVRDTIDTSYLPSPAVRMIRFFAARFPDYVVANSSSTLKSLHLPESKKNAVVPSGYKFSKDGGVFEPRLEAPSVTVITLVGRIARWKGQHVLIDAVRILKERGVPIKCKIAGESMFGENVYDEEIKEQILNLKLTDEVELLGFVENVPGFLSTCDILVHTSISPEPFGQVIIEGMAAKLPVIASAEGGPLEIVKDGVTGFLIKPNDSMILADAIQKLSSNEELAKKMGEAGYQEVLKSYTIEASARIVEKIYMDLAS